jgi:hypothetical protein
MLTLLSVMLEKVELAMRMSSICAPGTSNER